MSDVRFKNALAGVPRVNVVGPDGRIVFTGCYYWAVPATTYCFEGNYDTRARQYAIPEDAT